jgi:NIMA (never in mitosis gene a)-related kinase
MHFMNCFFLQVRRKLDDLIYVIKQINIHDLSTREQSDAINEVHIMASMECGYVVRYYDSFIDGGILCIVMEFCDRGDLQRLIKKQAGMPIPEERIWIIFLQVLLGVAYLHTRRTLHRDLKCANVFLCAGDRVKIGDLGVARVLGTESHFARTVCGTPYFLSPELVEGQPYNEKSDIWALGCVLCKCGHQLCMLISLPV